MCQWRSRGVTRDPSICICYDMEVEENRVRVFYGTERREKEKDSRYIQEARLRSTGLSENREESKV
jgi:hypothetical protein